MTAPERPTLDGVEVRWAARWEADGTYAFDRTASRPDVYAVDTPPPTVSGSLHVGHVFSYTHTDTIAGYQRMRGRWATPRSAPGPGAPRSGRSCATSRAARRTSSTPRRSRMSTSAPRSPRLDDRDTPGARSTLDIWADGPTLDALEAARDDLAAAAVFDQVRLWPGKAAVEGVLSG